MTKGRPRKLLLEGRGALQLWHVAELIAVRQDDLAALVESGALAGGLLSENGRAWAFFENELPTRDEVLQLGARPLDAGESNPCEDERGVGKQRSWSMEWED
jgi:hypothetical protein